MSRISEAFQPGRKTLIAYITAGYPDIESTPRIAAALAECGCDIIELGIPFSDPLADGATIQHASFQALQNGVTPGICLDIAGEISRSVTTPLVFMTYYNPVLYFGLNAFCGECRRAGVSGLIVPDLPPEEGAELEDASSRHDLDLIYLLAPTSAGERIIQVAERSRGFIYLVSLTGVTGARESLPADLESFIGRVREKTAKSLAVGFGIATAAQARRVASAADGIIVGSRLIQLIEEDPSLSSLRSFVTDLREAIDS